MLPGLASVRGTAGEDPKTALPRAQVPAEPGASQGHSVPVVGTVSTDLTETRDKSSNQSAPDHYKALSAGSERPDPVYGSDAPSPRRSSRPVLHPKHRVRAQDPYPTRKPARAARQDNSPPRSFQVHVYTGCLATSSAPFNRHYYLAVNMYI